MDAACLARPVCTRDAQQMCRPEVCHSDLTGAKPSELGDLLAQILCRKGPRHGTLLRTYDKSFCTAGMLLADLTVHVVNLVWEKHPCW
jgi:hypothetical protein